MGITAHSGPRSALAPPAWTEGSLSAKQFAALSSLIHQVVGIQLPPAKKVMLESRLRKRLRSLGLTSYTEYCDYVFGQGPAGPEMIQLIDVVTTNKTDFFREPQHFDYLVKVALPALAREQGAGTSRPLMVWSAGCSTGEEPYTLAMVLAEYAEAHAGFSSTILATDICTEVLEHAKRAIYRADLIHPIPPLWRRKYLLSSKDRQQGLVRIVPRLRQQVRFRRLNFLEGDFGMRESMDVIFCRNVFIYFDRPTQEAILNRFTEHLSPRGFVFLGHSESINGLDVPLKQEAPTIFRKSKGGAR
jgi:chemotaxis protein methyltransferase CheR